MQAIQTAQIYFNAENTPVSHQFDDVYFSNQSGLEESCYVFQEGNQLWQRWQQHPQAHFVIAETGFGTGLNFLAVSHLFQQFRLQFPQATLKRLFFISFEKYPLALPELRLAQQAYPRFASQCAQLQQHWKPAIQGCYRFHFEDIYLDLWFGDICDCLPQLGDYMAEKVDAWFLDGFSPSKNPEMWRDELYQHMFALSKDNGTFATFTSASAVRKGLQGAGFEVQKRKGFGKKREMLMGYKPHSVPVAPAYPWYLAQSASDPASLKEVAIIGGGIASAFCALALCERGAKVHLYCADNALAENASGNAQGAIYPQLSDDDERNVRFYIHAFAHAKQRLQQLAQQGLAFEHDFAGVALCAYDEKSAGKFSKIFSQNLPADLCLPMNATQLSQVAGLELPHGGAFIAEGGWLAPQQLVRNLFAHLQQQGVEIHYQQQIVALQQQQESWLLINQQGQAFQHQAVILANGHLINQFSQSAELPCYAVRGQVSQIASTPKLQPLKAVLCYDGYLTPANASGRHCLGASHVRDCADMAFSPAEQQQNQAKLQQNLAGVDWLKEVDCSSNQGKVGVRSALRDRMPLIGNLPNFSQQQQDYRNLFNLRRRKQAIDKAANWQNLFIIGALASRGLTSAPLLAESLVSQIYGEPLPLSQDILHNLSPNRSWLRKWLKGAAVK